MLAGLIVEATVENRARERQPFMSLGTASAWLRASKDPSTSTLPLRGARSKRPLGVGLHKGNNALKAHH